MSYIICPTCQEPWDTYHLKHDAIYDTDLPEEECKVLSDNGTPLREYVKKALEEDGWEYTFGSHTVLAFVRCPACPEDAPTKGAEIRKAIVDLLEDDEDALQTELEDLGFMYKNG